MKDNGVVISNSGNNLRSMEFKMDTIVNTSTDLTISLKAYCDKMKDYIDTVPRNLKITATPKNNPQNAKTKTAWVGKDAFDSIFYYRDIGEGEIDISFSMESNEDVCFEALTIYSAPAAAYREFDNGLVLANPSNSPLAFDLSEISPNCVYARIMGTIGQDTETNNGKQETGIVTLPALDALFLTKQQGDPVCSR